MKIQVSLSTVVAPLVADDRIIYEESKNVWRIGTLTEHRVKVRVMWIHFDSSAKDDDTRVFDDDTKRVHRIPKSTPKTKKILSEAQAQKLIGESSKPVTDPKHKLDEKLGLLYTQFNQQGNNLALYLLGEKVPDAWLTALSKRVSSEQPEILYRMCVVARTTKIGGTVNVSKSIVSSSDQKLNAIHAGCSYHVNNDISVAGKALALIEIRKPKCVLSHTELLEIVGTRQKNLTKTTIDEREYILSGPVRGKVIQLLDTDLIENGTYDKILPYLKKKRTAQSDAKMLLSLGA